MLATVSEFFSQYPDIVTHPEVRKLNTHENCLLYKGLKDQRILKVKVQKVHVMVDNVLFLAVSQSKSQDIATETKG